jgi:hypothetical protein
VTEADVKARTRSSERYDKVEGGGSGTIIVGDAVPEWWTLVTVCVGTFMLLLDVTIVNAALPKIQARAGSELYRLAVGCRRLRTHARGAPIDCRLSGRRGRA